MLHCLLFNFNFHNKFKIHKLLDIQFKKKPDSYNFNSLNLKKLILTPIGHDECVEIN